MPAIRIAYIAHSLKYAFAPQDVDGSLLQALVAHVLVNRGVVEEFKTGLELLAIDPHLPGQFGYRRWVFQVAHQEVVRFLQLGNVVLPQLHLFAGHQKVFVILFELIVQQFQGFCFHESAAHQAFVFILNDFPDEIGAHHAVRILVEKSPLPLPVQKDIHQLFW